MTKLEPTVSSTKSVPPAERPSRFKPTSAANKTCSTSSRKRNASARSAPWSTTPASPEDSPASKTSPPLPSRKFSASTSSALCSAPANPYAASLAARTGGSGGSGEWVHYAASKGAVDTFTIGLAREVADEGIRANVVSPGLIETGLHAANGEPGRLDRLAPSIPMRRPGTVSEIAEAVLWLLSPAASYVTGSILEIGGGR
jgi:NAD(P)-dependent dehydrogenase (short-subunit alcohol dehydrogenase family)